MTTISPNRRRWRVRSRSMLIVAGLLFVVVVGVVFFRAPLSGLLWRVLTPLSYVREVLGNGFQLVSGGFSSKAALVQENARLIAELASTTAQLQDRNALAVQNAHLLSELGRLPQGRFMLAGVLLRPPATPYDTLVLDAGAREGVRKGMKVFSGKAAVGTITEVYDTTARVVLFSAPGNEYQALLNGTTPVAIEGQGAGSLKGQVPSAVAVAVGDPVTLLGVTGSFVGSVSYVEAHEGESFKTMYMQLPKSLFELSFVQIALP